MSKLQDKNDKNEYVEAELTDVLLSFTDFMHFKDMVLQSKKVNLYVGGQVIDDDMFNFEALKKLAKDKEQWKLTNENK